MNNYVGKTYTFESVAFPNKMLNLYGSASDGKNVVLYDSDGSLEQQWKVVETGEVIYKLQTMKNTNYVLDRYVGSGSNYNNADVWTESANSNAEQEILIGHTLGNVVYISMPVYNGNTYVTTYYLTAVSNANGEADEKTPTSAGNVYWAEPLAENGGLTSAQKWRMVEVGGTSGGDTGNTGNENDIVISSSKYTYYCQQDYPWVNGAYGITTNNFQQTGCAAIACTMFMQIMADDSSIKPEDLFEWGVISNSGGYPWASWSTVGAPVNYTFSKVTSWSSAKSTIYNQLIIGRPVIIHLNGSNGGTHYVVGCGLKAGTNASNMTYDDIYVLDPWDFEHKTLQETMNHTNKWNTFDNVRIAQ